MKHLFPIRYIAPNAMVFTMALVLFTACAGKTPKGQNQDSTAVAEATPADNTAQDADNMKAPKIEADANGIITLAQCPTEYEGLKVNVTDDVMKATIYQGNQQLQTIAGDDEEPLATDGDKSVHFMDANFDGYVDIFIGAGASRTYSTLILWNPATKQFQRLGVLGEPMLQNFMLHPASKSVFEGGSASAFAYYFSRSIWENSTLKKVEELICVNDAEQYGEYEVNAPFTIRDGEGNTIATFQKAGELPAQWKALVEK